MTFTMTERMKRAARVAAMLAPAGWPSWMLRMRPRAEPPAPTRPLRGKRASGVETNDLTMAAGVTIMPMARMQPTAWRVVTKTRMRMAKEA